MGFFQNSVINKYRKTLDKEVVNTAYARFKQYFHNPEIQQNIRDAKEEQFQEGFLRELFVNILGYTLNPQPNYNLTTELKNEKGAKKADGAILKDGKALAVIELKGTDTKDLDKINTQAFNYKNNQTGCIYVITSNFEKLRFFIHNSVDHVEFDLFILTQKEFELLWFCLRVDSLLGGLPLKAKEESLLAEENVTKQLYKDYAAFKTDLWQNMVKNSPEADQLLLFKKTQKLLDRFLFIFFAEDSGLLPPNSISIIVKRWNILKEEDAYKPLYNIFKQYFGYINTGRKAKNLQDDIFAYNGGLFLPDDVLDNIVIGDEVLHPHVMKLTAYDFQSEVDVNILGHIFENSLNEIENVTAQLEGQEVDKSKTKRKKDGVFYTPKYITKYIVDNTIGKLCEEKKTELGIIDEEYAKGRRNRKKVTIKKLNASLQSYREWLLNIAICDPACGSGAFLNQALEFLIAEHAYIDELQAQLLEQSIVFQDVSNHILEQNIYGVDINEESVEIAKLSLWLRTAQKGRKLTSLNNNLKCGNSLIDAPEIAGAKAFNWHKEFPEVFTNGGFDVVIGNPPYVGEKGHSNIFESLKKMEKWATYYRRRSNTYYFFLKLGLELLKPNGYQSLIIPKEFISADWSNNVRKGIITKSIIKDVVDFNNLKVFEDAGTTSLILTQLNTEFNLEDEYFFCLTSLRNKNSVASQLYDSSLKRNISITKLDYSGKKPWNFYQTEIKFNKYIVPLNDLFDISQGLVTGADRVTNKHVVNGLVDESLISRGIFILTENRDIKFKNGTPLLKIENKWITLTKEEANYIKPYLKTENLYKWQVIKSSYYVIYVGSNDLTGSVRDYLMQFSGVLLNRSTTLEEGHVITINEFENYTLENIKNNYSSAGAVQKIMRRKYWWLPLYERGDVPFNGPKIIVNTKNMDKFTYSHGEHYSSGGGAGGQNFIYCKKSQEEDYYEQVGNFASIKDYTKFTNAILNSSLIQKFIKDGQYNQLSTAKIGSLPIIKIDFSKESLKKIFWDINSKVEQLISLTPTLNNILSDFFNFVYAKLNLNDSTNNFEEWDKLEFKDFLKNLKKAKVKLSLSEEAEWMQYYNEQKQKALELKSEIDRIDKEIDQLVYELYGLSEDEIKIVEQG